MTWWLKSSCAVLYAAAVMAAAAAGVSAVYFPLDQRIIDVARGEKLFRQRCASCHALESGGAASYGPSLADIGATAATRVADMSAEEYVFTSIVDPPAYRAPASHGEMPANAAVGLSDDQLLSLTAFLCSRGGEVRYRELVALRRPETARHEQKPIDLALAERGRRLYFDTLRCVACHPLDESPGADLYAPSLHRAGWHSPAHLREAILEPGKRIAPGFETCQVLHDGEVYTGRLLHDGRAARSESAVRLLIRDQDASFTVREFPTSELESADGAISLRRMAVSAMPDYRAVLSDNDVTALLEFLWTLR